MIKQILTSLILLTSATALAYNDADVRAVKAGLNVINGDLSGADLSGMNLSGRNFRGTSFVEARLVKVNFDKANLSETNFYRASLQEAT
ncbi:MAG: pentapeptide repeat-containing protein, partial [Acidaminococcaceae bacterium]|nr:pentapeptide repeat-containing protein [Acidaminococcaceae bacterium]